MHKLRPRQCAVSIMGLPHAGNRPRYASGQMSNQTCLRIKFSANIQIHVAVCVQWCDFSKVQKRCLTIDNSGHKSAATDIPCLWLGYREYKRCCNCRIYGVTTSFEYIHSGCGGPLIGHRHCSLVSFVGTALTG